MDLTRRTPGGRRARGDAAGSAAPPPRGRDRVLGALLAALVAACATGGGSPSDAEEGPESVVRFTVVNDIVPRTPATVRLVSEDGAVAFLGSVGPDREETFEFERFNVSGRYALRAETGQGGELRSNPFSLFPDAWISWELTSPTVGVGSARGGH